MNRLLHHVPDDSSPPSIWPLAETRTLPDTSNAPTERLLGETGPTPAPSHTVLPEVRNDGGGLVLVPRRSARYAPARLLGRGGSGEVKLAHDRDIDRKVALKRLRTRHSPQTVARFIDEVRTVGRLEHPNIVPIHDVGVDEDGALFFVMKYVEGETVATIIDHLRRGDAEYHRRFSHETRLDLFAGVLRALQYAHEHGIVHRDIKPENIMVGRYGEVVVMDWGVAHRVRQTQQQAQPQAAESDASLDAFMRSSHPTLDGAVIGTPQYMSPEQAIGEVADLDGRSDLYSAFVVLFELLTLERYVPRASTPRATLEAVLERECPDVFDPIYSASPHQDPVWAELRHFLARGLRHDPSERFSDAEEILWDLGRLRAGEFAALCPVTAMKRGNTAIERFMDRRPKLAFWLAIASTVVVGGGMFGWAALAFASMGGG